MCSVSGVSGVCGVCSVSVFVVSVVFLVSLPFREVIDIRVNETKNLKGSLSYCSGQ